VKEDLSANTKDINISVFRPVEKDFHSSDVPNIIDWTSKEKIFLTSQKLSILSRRDGRISLTLTREE
jgi:hypothetical protein